MYNLYLSSDNIYSQPNLVKTCQGADQREILALDPQQPPEPQPRTGRRGLQENTWQEIQNKLNSAETKYWTIHKKTLSHSANPSCPSLFLKWAIPWRFETIVLVWKQKSNFCKSKPRLFQTTENNSSLKHVLTYVIFFCINKRYIYTQCIIYICPQTTYTVNQILWKHVKAPTSYLSNGE